MACESPVMIYNESLKRHLVVPCGKCAACRISKVNSQVVDLYNYINKFDYSYFVTLTYDNTNLPFIVPFGFHVYRGLQFPYHVEEELPVEYEYIPGDYKKPSNHPEEYAIGVLYWRDIQLFHKRLRKYLYGKFGITGFKIITTGEYGSIGKRPHFHELYLSTCDISGQLQEAIISSWQMCDWSQLKFSECFKFGNSAVSSYLASYLDSCTSDYGVLSTKWFKAKTVRSKDTSFTVTDKVRKDFKKIFGSFGIGGSVYIEGKRTFEDIRQQRNGNFSVGLIRKRILYTYFYPPKESRQLSYNAFRKRCYDVYSNYYFGFKSIVNSSDYLFILSYQRYCDLFGYQYFSHNVFDIYLILAYRLWCFYESELLRYEMEKYPDMTREDYLRMKNNTYLDDDALRMDIFLRFSGYNSKFVRDNSYKDLPKSTLVDINKQKMKYGYKLLPKHFNQYLKNL